MKLIAETQEESSKLNGLSALLLDLGIDVDSYENEEAIAVSFWNAHDHMPVSERLAAMSELDRATFLYSIEDQLRAAMLAAGYRAIEHALDRAELGKYPVQRSPGALRIRGSGGMHAVSMYHMYIPHTCP